VLGEVPALARLASLGLVIAGTIDDEASVLVPDEL